MQKNECPCNVCNPKRPREPGTPFGTNGHGEWKQLNTYYVQFFEERWQHWMDRERKRREKQEAVNDRTDPA